MDNPDRKKTGLKKKIVRRKTNSLNTNEAATSEASRTSGSIIADPSDRVRELWRDRIPSGTLPGQTLGGESYQVPLSLPGGIHDPANAPDRKSVV